MPIKQPIEKLPIINAHSHVFTSKHVPPLLAKKFMPFPLYYLAHLDMIIGIYKFFRSFKNLYYQNWHRSLRRFLYYLSAAVTRNPVLKVLHWLFSVWLVLLAFYYLYDWIIRLTGDTGTKGTSIGVAIEALRVVLVKYSIFPVNLPILTRIVIVLFVLLFIKSGRNLIFFVFKKVLKFFKLIPGKESTKLIDRYLLIAKFAVYKKQTNIFSKMKDQYPKGSGFILLPMDMKYMKAGNCKESYQSQLMELEKIKTSDTYKRQGVKIHPFVFIDPRRIRDDMKNGKTNSFSKSDLFNYSYVDGQINLEKSLVKTFIEEHKFSGFKIYPAIGYYPFEKELLPLWKYAADNEIPIMSHCIKGTIFYRGNKKREWDEHWVFKDEDTDAQLLLPQVKNIEFQINFTHPMNFLCLIEEPFLRVLIEKYNDIDLKKIFGYTDSKTPLKHNLRNLKICLAHYGGEDQWKKYLEKDSYGYSQQIIKQPGFGIDFIKFLPATKDIDYNRLAQMWKYVDWYSIISSMMMRYPNVYADISYILHDAEIFPLLKETLKSRYGQLKHRVLFGTDFYVVRNHNSEKDLFVSSDALLSDEEFHLIAKENPRNFLKLTT
ncbi:amidohydrolase family protein [Flagellimonas sp. S3867]|uniref:amidohydrolase family protein n=1 Tax=Flagellimonas sp. S3867 TaxID=2768063 RepID=UPI001688659E|nr:amidohydrolase family protein [Flagellimonas sp. S3867]